MNSGAHFLLAACLLAQQPEPTIRVNVNLIQVDATVTDRSGKHVPDLQAPDFEVSREGKRQVIKSVLWVPGQRTGVAPSTSSASARTAVAGAGTLRPQDVRRTVAIMIDDLSLSLASVSDVRSALKRFVQENIDPRDLVAIYRTSSGLGMLQQFSVNRQQLLASIDRMRFGSMKAFDPLSPLSISSMEASSVESIAQKAIEQSLREDVIQRDMQDLRTAAMLGSVNLAVRGLRELPGRKSMVLISESIQLFDVPQGFHNPNLSSDRPGAQGGKRYRTEAAARSLVDTANRSGVMIYTLDPRGLVTPGIKADEDIGAIASNTQRLMGLVNQRQTDFNLSQDGMSVLAEETGGIFYRNTNDLAGALRASLEDQEGYYLIAFEPDDATFEKAKNEPKFQRLTVKVKRPGVSVRYRRGFFSTPDREASPMKSLAGAVLSPFRTAEVPVKLTPIFLQGEKIGPYLRTLLHIDAANLQFTPVAADPADPDQQPWQQAVLQEAVVLFDETGRMVDQVLHPQSIKVRGKGLQQLQQKGIHQQIDVPVPLPGPYQMRAAVMDALSQKTGSAAQFVEVPDLKLKRLALSSLVVSSVAYALNQDSAGHPAQRIIRPGAEFEYIAFIYNSKAGADGRPNLLTQLRLFRDGKVMYTGKQDALRADPVGGNQSLTLKGKLRIAEPGEYTLEVAVQDLAAPAKHQYALRNIDFTVQASDARPETSR